MKSSLSYPWFSLTILVMLLLLGNGQKLTAQPFGGYAQFDGVDDHLSAMAHRLLPSRESFTVEFWFQSCPDSLTEAQCLISNGNQLDVNLFQGSGGLTFRQLCVSDNMNCVSCHQNHDDPYDREWHHLAVTFDKNTEVYTSYIDGVRRARTPGNQYPFEPGGFFYVGYSGGNSFRFNHFEGRIDEMRVSNTLRYTADFSPELVEFEPDAYTTGLWHFNALKKGDQVIDDSGYERHFTAVNGAKIINKDSLISQNGTVLSVPDVFASVQWIYCSTGQPVPGGTQATYNFKAPGSYAVVVGDGSCSDTSNCFEATPQVSTSTTEVGAAPDFKLYPNPTEDWVNIRPALGQYDALQVLDHTGRIVPITRTDRQALDLSPYPPDIYFVIITDPSGIRLKAEKVVKYGSAIR